ncbi:unnamed protein product [Porites evermanni]|uniref:Uncharacterized protein n=1 Tax=Porites evermanni TaxID=104178 RepID=A0ABN8M9S0_9CNID|nr:unnamed protein product [Porites evermanni]
MTSPSPAARPAIGEQVAPTYSSLPDQPTNRSKACQVKTAVLLGSSSSIADSKAVNETLEVWLGYCIDLAVHTISIPSLRILSVVQIIDSIRSQYPSSTARKLAQFVGKVISMGFVFGNVTRIMTRYSHFDILRSPTKKKKKKIPCRVQL